MASKMRDLGSHDQVPDLDLAVFCSRDQLERVNLWLEEQARDDTSMASGEVVGLEAFRDIEHLDTAVRSTSSQEASRGIESKL